VIADRVDAQLASIRGVVEEILDPKKRALWLGSARDLTLRVASLLRLLNETSQSPRCVWVSYVCVRVKKGECRAPATHQGRGECVCECWTSVRRRITPECRGKSVTAL
jgi:hypothetical protein